jgi:asparagine synthase (glutamine-hydrolysing)
VLLETKEQFSDGVGYGWIDKLKEVVAVEVTDEQLANAKSVSVTNTYV